ncbi:MAG: TlpA family protein disulfide reductase [Flavisolibacter sp.]
MQKKISTFFREYITNYIFYSYLDNALSGYLATNKEIDPLLERQIGLATLADQQNELLIIDKYRSFLNTYNLYLSGDSSQGHGNYKSQLESALKNFGGNSKEYLSYIIAKNAIRKGDQNLTTLLNIFRSICKNERYLQRINEDEALLNLEKYGSGSDELISLNMEKTSLQNLVKATGAKIVFVDFWAGWCVPCMKELKYSSELAKNFSNDRRIKFMFISMDYSLPVWKKSVDSFNGLMTPDNSYLLLKGFSSNFAIKYHIQAIPRYLVINSNGEILNLDAPRPSDHKIIAYLNSFLNN